MIVHQHDPIAICLIFREILIKDVTLGKICSQIAHAQDYLRIRFNKLDRKYQEHINLYPDQPFYNIEPITKWNEWEQENHRKIVLKASEKEWARLKSEIKEEDYALVKDAGLSCGLEPGTETAIGIMPMRKSQRLPILKKLQTL
jgi:peptidyl-tRNA hydrolase